MTASKWTKKELKIEPQQKREYFMEITTLIILYYLFLVGNLNKDIACLLHLY